MQTKILADGRFTETTIITITKKLPYCLKILGLKIFIFKRNFKRKSISIQLQMRCRFTLHLHQPRYRSELFRFPVSSEKTWTWRIVSSIYDILIWSEQNLLFFLAKFGGRKNISFRSRAVTLPLIFAIINETLKLAINGSLYHIILSQVLEWRLHYHFSFVFIICVGIYVFDTNILSVHLSLKCAYRIACRWERVFRLVGDVLVLLSVNWTLAIMYMVVIYKRR